MADIGKLAVILTGNAQPLLGTLGVAQSALQGWAQSTVQALSGLVMPGFSNTAKAIEKAMTDTFASLRSGVAKFLTGFWDVNVKRIAAQMQFGALGLEIVKQIGGGIAAAGSFILKDVGAMVGGAGGGLWAKIKDSIGGSFGDLANSPVVKGIVAAFADAGRAVAPFLAPIAERAKVVGAALGGLAQSVGKWVGSTIGSVAHLASAVTLGLGGIGVAIVKDFIGAFAGGVEDLVRTDLTAKQLGLDVNELRAAMYYAGPAAGEMGQALGHLQDKFTALALGSGAARRDLQSLATASGTTVGALRAGGWSAVADAIASIPDPTARAAQAFRLFGESAGPLLQQFQRGAAGNSKGVIARLGLGADAGDLAAVRTVSQAMRDLQAVGAGVFNQALLGVAPIAAQLSKSFADWKLDLTFIKPLVIDVAEGIALFGAFVRESARNSKLLGDGLDLAFKVARSGWLELQATMMDGIAELLNRGIPTVARGWAGATAAMKALSEGKTQQEAADALLKAAASAEKLYGGMGDGLKAAAAEARGQAKGLRGEVFGGGELGGQARWLSGLFGGGAVSKSLDSIAAQADKGGLLGKLMGDLDKTEWGKGVRDFFAQVRADAGKTGDMIKDAMGAKVAAALTKSYEGMATGLQRPAEAFGKSMRELGLMGGLGIGDPRTRALLANKAGMDLLSAAGTAGGPAFAASAEAQTREAYSSVARFDAEGQRGGIQEQVLDALRALKMLEERQAENGARIAQAAEETARNTREGPGERMGGRL